jgi:hypothetical protein
MFDVAYSLGVYLCPLAQDVTNRTNIFSPFMDAYLKYDGILVGNETMTLSSGHAIAKVGENLIDPKDGLQYHLFGKPYQNLYQRKFFAWTKHPRTN